MTRAQTKQVNQLAGQVQEGWISEALGQVLWSGAVIGALWFMATYL
jgi:hypothetical protein